MTNRIIVPLADGRWLALSREQFSEALGQGARLMPSLDIPEPEDGPQWLSAKQMAELTGMSETYWQEEARCGRAPSRRFGRSLRFPVSYLRSLDVRSTSHNGAGQ